MLDADDQRFRDKLSQTPTGLRLRMAVNEMNIAIAQIGRLKRLNSPRLASAIASWQRAYIKACDRRSELIDRLFDTHQWPADGGRDRRYAYQPPPALKS